MSSIVSPTAGTRTEPIDSLTFVRGTTAVFKITFMNEGKPTKVDTGTNPIARIIAPKFVNGGSIPLGNQIATITGSLVPGQQYEYQFEWDIPSSSFPLDNYIVSYEGTLGGLNYNFGDEFFTISAVAGLLGTQQPAYATVDDIRKKKFNIDSYLPKTIAKDLASRNQLIHEHILDGTKRLREELALHKARGFSDNYRLFVIYYAIWSILLASRGEDGSSVADQNLLFWRSEWERILAQEKRESLFQGLPMGRG